MFLFQVAACALAWGACWARYRVSSSRRGRIDAVALACVTLLGLALGAADVFIELPLSVVAAAGVGYVAITLVVFRRQIVDTRRLQREVAELERVHRRARS